jgi:hypothetical protein
MVQISSSVSTLKKGLPGEKGSDKAYESTKPRQHRAEEAEEQHRDARV